MRTRLLVLLVALALLGGVVVVGEIVRAGSPDRAVLAVIELAVGGPVSGDSRPVRFVLRPGESATMVGQELQDAGLVRSALGFRLAVRLSGVASHLEAGDYQLRPNMPMDEVISVLAQGRMVGGLLTIPEGWRALEIADALQRNQITSRQEFLRAVHRPDFSLPSFLRGLPAGSSLEGFLFPDSYRFAAKTPADQVVRAMVTSFGAHLTPGLLDGFQANGLTIDQAVTLASIVEREAVLPAERPIIASVYLNRLRRGMKLQADPTVQYALVARDGLPDSVWGYWKPRLSFADLRVVSPYNTYEVVGLPPGPICNPGLASLEAVAHPAVTDYLYFVAKPDRSHAFARTLQEQEENVARYEVASHSVEAGHGGP